MTDVQVCTIVVSTFEIVKDQCLTFGEKFGQGVVELGGILFGGGRSHGRGSAFGADREIHGRDL
jgi:hypothetical protein